jgi:hypothetical protein
LYREAIFEPVYQRYEGRDDLADQRRCGRLSSISGIAAAQSALGGCELRYRVRN